MIEKEARDHCNPESPGCIIGLVVARGGNHFKSFAIEFNQDITPDQLEAALQEIARNLKIDLRIFDEGRTP